MSHLALVGPTASGKSWLALELARRLPDIELVSVDSMQVYRGMDIGTAKPSPDEQAEIPHHLVDLVDPEDEFTLSEFQAAAREAIDGIEARGHRALLVGGTGLYLQAVVDALELPGRFPAARAEVEAEPDTAALYRRLADVDPVTAAKTQPGNRRRIERALEVSLGSGRPFSAFGPGIDAFPSNRFALLGIWLPRRVGGERIAERVVQMVEAGWVDEVRRLRDAGPMSTTAAQALGYKELGAHLDGSTSLDEALDRIVRRTRSFARRQRVWFRRDPRIKWFATGQDTRRLLPALLEDCARKEGGERRP